MAKGFTVKAKSPIAAKPKKEPEWDFEEARKMGYHDASLRHLQPIRWLQD